jgi:hypothetical protein
MILLLSQPILSTGDRASGYFEWKTPDGKQHYFISTADGGVLSKRNCAFGAQKVVTRYPDEGAGRDGLGSTEFTRVLLPEDVRQAGMQLSSFGIVSSNLYR